MNGFSGKQNEKKYIQIAGAYFKKERNRGNMISSGNSMLKQREEELDRKCDVGGRCH